MGLKQSMKQSLGMAMTPQLQQAIKILQMSVLELQQEVTSALVENPTLEEAADESGEHQRDATEIVKEPQIQSSDTAPTDSANAGKDDMDWQQFIEDGNWTAPLPSTRNFNSDDLPSYEQVLSRTSSLADHLVWQMRLSDLTDEQMHIGEEIIGNLNEDGYLMVLLEELAQELKVDQSEIEVVLYRIQRMDPPGVAARSLQECLLIQAELLEEDDELEMIIEKHMPELENKNYAAISKAMDLPLERVKEKCKVIHQMEPKPGRIFASNESQFVVPDIYVMKVGKEFMVVLNEDGIPRLKISKSYQEQIASGELKGETKSYVKEKLKSAAWLMKSIFQRQRTVFRVTEVILKRQIEFFEKGPQALKPMVLKDIADELGLHESTISRVTNNKFVHTPHGIYELKYFFNSAISRSDGEDMASESVKQKIKALVSEEKTTNPLSDQQIADMLAEEKINIARRTVAKYREAMGILPSSKRKKFF